MPRFTSPEQKEAWLAKCAATRAKNQKAKKAKPAELANGFQDQTTVGDVPRGGHRVHNIKTSSGGILGAVEEIDSKIAALQQVRKNLIHAHELVMA